MRRLGVPWRCQRIDESARACSIFGWRSWSPGFIAFAPIPARTVAIDQLESFRPQQWVDRPVPGNDPFLAGVSQNKGRVTGLFRYEILGLLQCTERTRSRLLFDDYERMRRIK